jgi:hypothetical protein
MGKEIPAKTALTEEDDDKHKETKLNARTMMVLCKYLYIFGKGRTLGRKVSSNLWNLLIGQLT